MQTEEDMLKMHLSVPLAALMAGSAWAQTSPGPAPIQGSTVSAGSGQVLTEMQPNLMRGSKLMGIDVYGSDNQKIGDIDEVLLDRDGRIHAVVIGIGGFLGIGQKDVAISFGQLQWMSNEEARAATNAAGAGTSTAGGVTMPANPAGTAPMGNQPATTGSTGMASPGTGTGGSVTTPARGAADGTPARAMVSMSKADLQNAPEFRYSTEANRNASPAGNTNPPPASANRPGNTPQQ